MLTLCNRRGWIPIVITHYPPSFKCINKRRANDECRYLYANNFDNLIDVYRPKIWIAGHTHENFDKTIYNTRIISNQKGKKTEHVTEYKRDFYIDI